MKFTLYAGLALCSLAGWAQAWTKEDHEIFRLRDELRKAEGANITFYDFLGVKSTATQAEINQAYRKRSRLLHPDKAKQSFIAARSTPRPKPKEQGSQQQQNSKSGSSSSSSKNKGKKPGVHVSRGPSDAEIRRAVKLASERFTRLGLIANILRGPGRERYDHFLRHGFPAWRGTGYYYVRYRPGLGAVLLGLFVVGGGAAHYLALYLSWKRQRDFVARCIRQARRAAWGDESGIRGITTAATAAAAASSSALAAAGDEDSAGAVVQQSLNRRQRRQQEKENRKAKTAREPSAGSSSAAAAAAVEPVRTGGGSSGAGIGPTGDKRRVMAENGKMLVVDSVGNVFVEEENEDGQVEEFLLDINEIRKPTIRQTVLFRLPAWLVMRAKDAVLTPITSKARRRDASSSSSSSSPSSSTAAAAAASAASPASPSASPSSPSGSSSDADSGEEVSVDAKVPSAPNGGARWQQAQKNRAKAKAKTR